LYSLSFAVGEQNGFAKNRRSSGSELSDVIPDDIIIINEDLLLDLVDGAGIFKAFHCCISGKQINQVKNFVGGASVN
jgi:hypothetical protein